MFRSERRKEAGSVAVLTLLAFSLLAGVFLYVALIGSRTAETTKVRVAADSTALASATVKAKVMNLESYVLLADTVLLPLAHVADNIELAQGFGMAACLVAFWEELGAPCFERYMPHMIETAENQPAVKVTVDGWLDGLAAMADALKSEGPLWAEVAAVRAGTSDSFQGTGSASVSGAVSFPVPGKKDSPCSQLGIELVSSEDEIRDGDRSRNACHDKGWLGEVYIATAVLKGPLELVFDELGWEVSLRSLLLPLPCSKEIKVPKLSDDWKDHSISYGVAMSDNTSDRDILPIMDRLMLKNRGNSRPYGSLGDLRKLVRVSCAEHYSQDHHSKDSSEQKESLWHMDWRARLVPCDFERGEAAKVIDQCGDSASVATVIAGPLTILEMQAQLLYQRSTGATKYWKF